MVVVWYPRIHFPNSIFIIDSVGRHGSDADVVTVTMNIYRAGLFDFRKEYIPTVFAFFKAGNTSDANDPPA